MLRFVRGPDAVVTPDLRRKLPGRGVWLTASRAVVAEAVKKGAFARGFKGAAIAAPDLPDEVDRLIERDALQSLSMANKAGAVTTGFAKVEALLVSGKGRLLLHATDAARDGRRKMGQIFARVSDGTGLQARLFDSSQLGLALGRPHVIHAALMAGPATEAFEARCRKLAEYRGTPATAANETGDENTDTGA